MRGLGHAGSYQPPSRDKGRTSPVTGTVLGLVAFLFAALPGQAAQIPLDDTERRVLAQYPSISMCVDPDWLPYERITADNRYEGMVADYMALISKKLGVPIELKPTASWAETVAQAKAGNCTIVAAMNLTEERTRHFDFTSPYINSIMVIVTRSDEFYLGDVSALGDRPLVLVDGYRIIDELKKTNPGLNIVLSENEEASFKQVASGTAFATIASPLSANHVIRTLGLANLKVSGQVDIEFSLRTAVPKVHAGLHPIIDRAIQSITREESDRIYQSWLSLKYEREIQWQEVIGFVAAAIVIGGVIVLWNYKLRAVNGRLRTEIEERRRAEEKLAATAQALQESDRQKNLILGIISHDMKNLFNSLMIYAHLLDHDSESRTKPDTTGIASKIKMIGRNSATVLENLLEWVTFDAGDQKTELEYHDLASLAHSNAALVGPEAERKNIRVVVDAPISVPVFSDRRMTDMVVRNITGNAVKFTQTGGTVTLRVRVNGDLGMVEVEDTGIGMSAEQVRKLFESDRNVSHNGTDGEMGTGLGLAFCRQLLDANGGDIAVRSTPGEGSTFTVSFPRASSQDSAAA